MLTHKTTTSAVDIPKSVRRLSIGAADSADMNMKKAKQKRRPLGEQERLDIRADYKTGLTFAALEDKYKRSGSHIATILKGLTGKRKAFGSAGKRTKRGASRVEHSVRRAQVALEQSHTPASRRGDALQSAVKTFAKTLTAQGVQLKGISIDFERGKYTFSRVEVGEGPLD